MAGLFFSLCAEPNSSAQLLKTAQRMVRYPWLSIKKFCSPMFVAAVVFPEKYPPIFFEDPTTKDFVAVFGEIYPDDSLYPPAKIVSWISAMCETHNHESLKNINGLYNLIHWNNTRKELTIANDCTGALLLFQTKINNNIIWSSEPGLLTTINGFNAAIDQEAVKETLESGYASGNRTSFKSISVLPPASVIRFKHYDNSFSEKVNTGCTFTGESFLSYKKSFCPIFENAVALRLGKDNNSDIVLPLSGGEDSRLILAAMRSINLNPDSVTLDSCQRGDNFWGKKIASIASLPNQLIEMDTTIGIAELNFLKESFSATMDWHCIVMLHFLRTFATGKVIPIGFLGGTLAGAGIKHDKKPLPSSALPFTLNNSDLSLGSQSVLSNLYGRQRRYTGYFFRMAWNFGKPVCPFSDKRVIELSLTQNDKDLNHQSARRKVFYASYPDMAKVCSGNDLLPIKSMYRRRLKRALSGTIISRLVKKTGKLPDVSFQSDRYQPVYDQLSKFLIPDQIHSIENSSYINTSACRCIAAAGLYICHKNLSELPLP